MLFSPFHLSFIFYCTCTAHNAHVTHRVILHHLQSSDVWGQYQCTAVGGAGITDYCAGYSVAHIAALPPDRKYYWQMFIHTYN